VRIADVTDGTSNTILIGEDKPLRNCYLGQTDDTYGWLTFMGHSIDTVVIPMNFPIKYNMDDSIPDVDCPYSPWNWGVANGFKSNHTGGCNFAFADGSVHFINENIDQLTYIKLGVRFDGGVVTLP